MSEPTYISDTEAAALVQTVGIAESKVMDDFGSTVSTLHDGATLSHYCNPNKLVGWEYELPATSAEPQPVAAQGQPIPVPAEPTVTNDAPPTA